MNKIVIAAIIIVLILIVAGTGTFIYFTTRKVNQPSVPTSTGTRPVVPAVVGTAAVFKPNIIKLKTVRCADPSTGNEVDYGVEVGGTIYTCKAGSKTKTEDSDVLVFDPAASRPKGTVKLWMVFTGDNSVTYTTTSESQPTGTSVFLGYVWLVNVNLPSGDTLDIKVNTATLNGRLVSYLTTRPNSDAAQYGWATTSPLAKGPSRLDVNSYTLSPY